MAPGAALQYNGKMKLDGGQYGKLWAENMANIPGVQDRSDDVYDL